MKYFPVEFAVPSYAADRLYDCAMEQHKEASPESLRRALETLFIREPETLASYLTPIHHHVGHIG